MPILGNAKHELYAKHRANGFIPKKAALAAGFASGSSIYTSLEDDALIVARIHELIDAANATRDARREAARVAGAVAGEVAGNIAGVSHGWVLEQLKQNAEDAAQRGDYKEANAALKLIGDHLGMFKTAAGDGDGQGQGDAPLTMEAIERLTNATQALEPPTEVGVIDTELAMRLIEGHGTPANLAKDRQLQTGSETDVALQDDDAIDAEFEDTPQ